MLPIISIALIILIGLGFLAFLAIKLALIIIATIVAAVYVGAYLVFSEGLGLPPLSSAGYAALAGTVLLAAIAKINATDNSTEAATRKQKDYWDNGHAARMLKRLESNNTLTREQKLYKANEYAIKKLQKKWWQFWI